MAVTGQSGILSFGPQAAMGTAPTMWYQHRATDVDLSVISDDRLGPPEVGGIPTPTIPYRAGVMATGGALINPRLEDTLGWLLHGAMGAWSVTPDQDVLGTTVTSMYNHEFVFATNKSYVPWMGFRKLIPGSASDGSDAIGEVYTDCKIVALTLALPNDGLVTARVDVLGRAASDIFGDPSGWTYQNTQFEDYYSIPIGCVTTGYLQIPGFSANDLPITACNITLTNAPLDVRQEKVYGSPYLNDVTIVGRSLEVDMILKWEDAELYRKIQTGTTTGTNWNPAPFTSDLDVLTVSASLMGGVSPDSRWQLRAQAEEVMYRVVGGVRLAGNNAVMLRVQGTAIAPASGEYATFNLGNKVNSTSYLWPTVDSTPPTRSSAEVGAVEDDNTIIVTYSEAIKLSTGTDWALGHSVKVATVPTAIIHAYQYAATKIALVVGSPITTGQTVLTSYTSTTGKVADLTGNALASYTDQAVTNTT